MRTRILSAVIISTAAVMVMIGCSANWDYKALDEFTPQDTPPAAQVCSECHVDEHKAWMDTKHSKGDSMSTVTVDKLKECGACHTGVEMHASDRNAPKPPDIGSMTKSEQNAVCGKCHFNKDVLGSDAINPGGKHSPIMSVGFSEDKKRQLSCLDCHSGHKGKAEMLKNIKAHVCFTCHKEAIVTMGIFQPFNYLAFGKACQLCHNVHGGTTAQHAGHMAIGVATCLPCHV